MGLQWIRVQTQEPGEKTFPQNSLILEMSVKLEQKKKKQQKTAVLFFSQYFTRYFQTTHQIAITYTLQMPQI